MNEVGSRPDFVGAGAPVTEINITPAMSEAGALALSRIKDDVAEGHVSLRDAVALVYCAMRETQVITDDDEYLDYDPLPYELALRASYAQQALLLSGAEKKAENHFDASNARVQLFGDIASHKDTNFTKND